MEVERLYYAVHGERRAARPCFDCQQRKIQSGLADRPPRRTAMDKEPIEKAIQPDDLLDAVIEYERKGGRVKDQTNASRRDIHTRVGCR